MLILRGAKLLKISHATKCLRKYFVQHFLIYFVWTSYCLFYPRFNAGYWIVNLRKQLFIVVN